MTWSTVNYLNALRDALVLHAQVSSIPPNLLWIGDLAWRQVGNVEWKSLGSHKCISSYVVYPCHSCTPVTHTKDRVYLTSGRTQRACQISHKENSPIAFRGHIGPRKVGPFSPKVRNLRERRYQPCIEEGKELLHLDVEIGGQT